MATLGWKRFLTIGALVTGLLAAGVPLLTAQANTAPFLPGITAKDEHPNGCVSCHVNAGADKDYRLTVELAGVKNHPKIDKLVNVVPGDCLKCHKEGAKAGALGFVAHRNHYRNPKENVFIKVYQGACLNCHTVNPETGVVSVKSGPKNW